MSDFVDVPIIAEGAVRLKWGLHWVRRIVQVRASGFVKIYAPKGEEATQNTHGHTDLHLSKFSEAYRESANSDGQYDANADDLDIPADGDDPAASARSGISFLTDAVKDIGFIRSIATGVSEYFANAAELTLLPSSTIGPPNQLHVANLYTCDAQSAITTSTVSRTLSFASQKHRMQWVAIFETTGAKLMSIRPPLQPVVTNRTSTSVSLDWTDYSVTETSQFARENEMFEIEYRQFKRTKKSKQATEKRGDVTTGAATSTVDALPTAAVVTDSGDDDQQWEQAKPTRSGGFLAAVSRRAQEASSEVANDPAPLEQVPYEDDAELEREPSLLAVDQPTLLTVVKDWTPFTDRPARSESSIPRSGGSGVGTQTTLSGLRPKSLYEFRIRQKGFDQSRKSRGWSLWSPSSEVITTFSSTEQRLRDNERRVENYFSGKFMPYKAVFRAETLYTKTMRIFNFSINAAYQLGVPYGTVAYWGWQAVGVGQVGRCDMRECVSSRVDATMFVPPVNGDAG